MRKRQEVNWVTVAEGKRKEGNGTKGIREGKERFDR